MSESEGLFPTAVNDTLVGKEGAPSEKGSSAPIIAEGDDITIIIDDSSQHPAKSNPNSKPASKIASQEQSPNKSGTASQNASQPRSPREKGEEPQVTILDEETPEKNEKSNEISSESQEVYKSQEYQQHQQEQHQQQQQEKDQQPQRKKPPPHNMTYRQEHEKIPAHIRNNPHVAKRLNTYPVRPSKPPRAALSSAAEYRTKREISLDEYTSSLIDDKCVDDNPTIEQLKSSAHQLRNLEKELIEKSDYVAAKKVNATYEYVSERMKRDSFFNDSKATIEELISKRNELNALVEHIESDYNQKIDDHNSAMAEKAGQMRDQHQEELDQFDENLPTELRPLFKRNSVTYLKMRSEEKNLALNKKFDEAISKKKLADMLEKTEEQKNYEKMNDYYREKRMRILEQQNKTVVNFSQYAGARLLEIKARKTKTIDPMKQRIAMLNRLIEKMCNKRGIKPQQLDFDHVDQERVEMLKTKETQSQIPKRASSAVARPPKSATIKKPVLSQTGKM